MGFSLLGFHLKPWPMVFTGSGEDLFWSWLSIAFFVIGIVLMLANAMFVVAHLLACVKRRTYYLLPAALLMPFYWILISLGAWKGLWQLFTNPFYWEKTLHGLDQQDQKPPG
jgi:hypothetical protein